MDPVWMEAATVSAAVATTASAETFDELIAAAPGEAAKALLPWLRDRLDGHEELDAVARYEGNRNAKDDLADVVESEIARDPAAAETLKALLDALRDEQGTTQVSGMVNQTHSGAGDSYIGRLG